MFFDILQLSKVLYFIIIAIQYFEIFFTKNIILGNIIVTLFKIRKHV